MNNKGVEAWLEEKGWTMSPGGWWLPPNGPKGHYKSSCYRLTHAVKTEAELRGLTVTEVYARNR